MMILYTDTRRLYTSVRTWFPDQVNRCAWRIGRKLAGHDPGLWTAASRRDGTARGQLVVLMAFFTFHLRQVHEAVVG
jgi:hypothetical protein